MGQKFKRTPFGEIPVDWETKNLKEMGPVTDGDWILTSDYSATGVRLLQIGDIGVGRFIGKSKRFISEERARELGCNLLNAGDILISRMPDPIGRACILPELDGPSITAVDVAIWRPDTTTTDRRFLTYCLNSSNWFALVGSYAAGSTRTRISRSLLEAIEIPLPPLREQRRITEILSAVDERIEKTHSVLEKLRDLKHGVLQRFFGAGKQVAKVPEGWQVLPLIKVSTLQRGVDLPMQSRRSGGVPVYGSSGILGHHDETEFKGPGVITGRSGTIGQVYFCEGPYWPLNTTLHVVDFHGNNPRFIALLLAFLRLEQFAASTGVPSLNRNFVHPVLVAVPPLKDQEHLVKIIEYSDRQILAEEAILISAKKLRDSLMQALLVGKVRTIK